MQRALHEGTTVQPGGKTEIAAQGLPVGAVFRRGLEPIASVRITIRGWRSR